MLPRGDTALKSFVDSWLQQEAAAVSRMQERWLQVFARAGPPHS